MPDVQYGYSQSSLPQRRQPSLTEFDCALETQRPFVGRPDCAFILSWFTCFSTARCLAGWRASQDPMDWLECPRCVYPRHGQTFEGILKGRSGYVNPPGTTNRHSANVPRVGLDVLAYFLGSTHSATPVGSQPNRWRYWL